MYPNPCLANCCDLIYFDIPQTKKALKIFDLKAFSTVSAEGGELNITTQRLNYQHFIDNV